MVIIIQDDKHHAHGTIATLIESALPGSVRAGKQSRSRLSRAGESLHGPEVLQPQRCLDAVKFCRECAVDLIDYEVPFKGIVEQSIAGIYILQGGRFQYVNETFAFMCGLHRDRLMGARLRDVANPEQVTDLMAQYERLIQGGAQGERFVIRRTLRHRPGSFEIYGTRVILMGRPAIVGVSIDITEQERQRQDLMAASARLQELMSNANMVREKERNRVARELHDVVGGMLTAIKFDLSRVSWAVERLISDSTEEVVRTRSSALTPLNDTVKELIQLTQETVEAVRAVSEGLRPGALDHLGLCETISQGLSRFEQRFGIKARMHMQGDRCVLSEATEISIYRVFQEALTNVARHSRATEVEVDLSFADDFLSVQIQDNGTGFANDDTTHAGHLGILGMHERARELGGRAEFTTSPKSGARVRITIPLTREIDAPKSRRDKQ